MNRSNPLVITQPLRVFGLSWLGQLLSLIGSGLTSFAIGVEIYRLSGSITQFSLFYFSYYVPLLLLSPLAGTLADRWDRRKVLLLSDVGAGFGSLLIWLLLQAGEAGMWTLQAWHFYPAIALGAAFSTLRRPALQATTVLLIPKQHLGRANGLTELAVAAGQVAAPVLAGGLVPRIGMKGIILIDLLTFLFSVGVLLLIRFPRPPESAEGQSVQGSMWKQTTYGWTFIRTRPGLMGLLLYSAHTNLVMGLVTVLITPLVLSFADIPSLGMVVSASGLGMLLGGIFMSAWGGPKRRMLGVLGTGLPAGAVLLLAGLPPTLSLVSFAASAYLFTLPIQMSCVHTIWQSKVAPDLQGRVFAVRRMVAMSASPVAALLAGPLADDLFEPWLAPGGALADSVGRLIGTGPGRGIGFLFVAMGLLSVLATVMVWLSPRVRRVEDELPDALPASPPSVPAQAPVPAVEAGAEDTALPPTGSGDPSP